MPKQYVAPLAKQDPKLLSALTFHEQFTPEISTETSLAQFPGFIFYAHSCSLVNFNLEFNVLQQLTVVSLDKNIYTEIPKNILLLPELKILSMQHCKIVSIPMEISLAKKLEALYLNHNNLSTMDILMTATKLQILSLSVNLITSVPESVVNLQSLVFLDLAKNALLKFPTHVLLCEKLQYLSLSHNFISVIPNLEVKCPIKALFLDKNKLSLFPSYLFKLGIPNSIVISGNLEYQQCEVFSQFVEDNSLGTKNCNTVKLLVLGNGGVGVYCLLILM